MPNTIDQTLQTEICHSRDHQNRPGLEDTLTTLYASNISTFYILKTFSSQYSASSKVPGENVQSQNEVSTGAYQTVTTHHLQGSEEPILSSERVGSCKNQLNEATKPPPHYVNIGASYVNVGHPCPVLITPPEEGWRDNKKKKATAREPILRQQLDLAANPIFRH